MSFTSSLSCTSPVVVKVTRWPFLTVMPVEVQGWFAWTVIAPGTAGVLAIAGVVPEVATATFSGREITMRATSLEAISRSPLLVLIVRRSGLVPPMSYSEPSIVWPLRSTTCDVPVNFAQSASVIVPPVKSITETSFCGIVTFGAVHPHRVADAAEIDELSAHLLTGAQRQRCALLRVRGARQRAGPRRRTR